MKIISHLSSKIISQMWNALNKLPFPFILCCSLQFPFFLPVKIFVKKYPLQYNPICGYSEENPAEFSGAYYQVVKYRVAPFKILFCGQSIYLSHFSKALSFEKLDYLVSVQQSSSFRLLAFDLPFSLCVFVLLVYVYVKCNHNL